MMDVKLKISIIQEEIKGGSISDIRTENIEQHDKLEKIKLHSCLTMTYQFNKRAEYWFQMTSFNTYNWFTNQLDVYLLQQYTNVK